MIRDNRLLQHQLLFCGGKCNSWPLPGCHLAVPFLSDLAPMLAEKSRAVLLGNNEQKQINCDHVNCDSF